MEQLVRRVVAFLLLVAMLLPLGVTEAAAVEDQENAETGAAVQAEEVVKSADGKSGHGLVKHTNPLYPEHELTINVPKYEETNAAKSYNGTYYQSVASAGKVVRTEMKKRTYYIEVALVLNKTDDPGDYCYDVFDAAVAHTGVPTEGDYLLWQYGGWQCYYSWYDSDGKTYITFEYYMEYYTTASQEAEMDTAIAKLMSSLKLNGKNTYQKIRAMYDYLCENITYDYANLNDKTYMLKHTAYAALIHGTSVCQGYSVLFYRMCLEAGIDNRCVPSILEENHIWNIVKCGGLYYNMDATWDAGQSYYSYFMKCPSTFYGHTRDAEYETSSFHKKYPMATKDFDPSTYVEEDDTGDVTVPQKPYKIVNVVSGVHVYWKKVTGAKKYGVWRSETGINGTYKWIANPTTNHFTDTSVKSGKTYHYKITAMNSAGKHSNKSQPASIIYVSTPDISARYNKANGIKLDWKKVTGATGYAIYRKSYTGNDAWVRVATINGNATFTWTDTSVKNNNGTIYKYTIRALAGQQKQFLSGCRNAGRTMIRLVSRTLTTSSPKAGSIKCTWNATKAASGYQIRLVINGDVYRSYTVKDYATAEKVISGLPTGIKYHVQVRIYRYVKNVGTFYSAWSTVKAQRA